MADQWTDLGFSAREGADQFFAWGWPRKELVDLEDGLYLRWQAAPCIQCWVSVGREGQELLDWEVHFLTGHQNGVAFDTDCALDEAGQSGNIRVLLDPGEAEIPVVAAVPVLAYWPDRFHGSPGLAQFACYAEALSTMPEDTPETLLSDGEEPLAQLTGHVAACERCVNECTGASFLHVTLMCHGCTFDLLADETLLPELPAPGTALRAKCRITAMMESGVTG